MMIRTLTILAAATIASAATPFTDWLNERKLCQTSFLGTPTKWTSLCDNAQYFDEIGIKPNVIMPWVCLSLTMEWRISGNMH